MALVVLLRGVNVGGHRTFRPTTLVRQLEHLDVVNIGAAGTFVVRKSVPRSRLRAELTRLLPFETEIMICEGREILALMTKPHFADEPEGPDIVRFVSVLSRRPSATPATPISFPPTGEWLLKIVARDSRFIFGMYRRHMKAIGQLSSVDRLFGVPATTRNWNTVAAIARVLEHGAGKAAGA